MGEGAAGEMPLTLCRSGACPHGGDTPVALWLGALGREGAYAALSASQKHHEIV